jgi:hypothetical protein
VCVCVCVEGGRGPVRPGSVRKVRLTPYPPNSGRNGFFGGRNRLRSWDLLCHWPVWVCTREWCGESPVNHTTQLGSCLVPYEYQASMLTTVLNTELFHSPLWAHTIHLSHPSAEKRVLSSLSGRVNYSCCHLSVVECTIWDQALWM